MIHSLAGGSIREKKVADFYKVELLEGINKGGLYWYISSIKNLNEGDIVIVPIGANNIHTKGQIKKIQKSVVQGCSPVPFNVVKSIIKRSE